MRTSEEYRKSLLKLKPNVYIDGELVSRDDPMLRPGVNVIAKTFDLAADPKYQEVMVATSPFIGKKNSRFTHIHQSVEELLLKQKMVRFSCHHTGGCIQRCMGNDTINALSVVTYEMDQALGTEYHQRFLNFLRHYQENDLVGNAAQTDVKGDRSKRPHQQVDPDLYLRVVEKRRDGIVVRGTKAHNTMGAYSEEFIVLPTRTLTEEEGDWAVAFAVPADAEGLYLITRATSPRQRRKLKAPIGEFGVADSFAVFDNVFVPWERVFMCGEREYAGRLAILFALFHRHSYTGCKPAMTDVLMGATALVAEYNGVERADHIRHKLVDMISVAELVYAAGIAAAVQGQRSPSGTYIPNTIYANVGRRHAGLNIYHESDILADVAGGLVATLPPEGDFYNEITAHFMEKYMMRNPKISAEDQHRCFRLISDLICSAYGGVGQIAGVHGGGSPIMEAIAILGNYNLEAKKDVAKYLAGIEKEYKGGGVL